jgi:hypothetical protein
MIDKKPHPGEWCVIAVIRLRPDDLRRIDEDSYQVLSFLRWADAVFIAPRKETAKKRKLLYETLLKIDWLPTTLRSAILREMGTSLRERKREFMERQTAELRYLINQTKARMRKNGERPARGSLDDAAIDKVAKQVARSSDALKQQLKRYKKYRLWKRAKVKITEAGKFEILP